MKAKSRNSGSIPALLVSQEMPSKRQATNLNTNQGSKEDEEDEQGESEDNYDEDKFSSQNSKATPQMGETANSKYVDDKVRIKMVTLEIEEDDYDDDQFD